VSFRQARRLQKALFKKLHSQGTACFTHIRHTSNSEDVGHGRFVTSNTTRPEIGLYDIVMTPMYSMAAGTWLKFNDDREVITARCALKCKMPSDCSGVVQRAYFVTLDVMD